MLCIINKLKTRLPPFTGVLTHLIKALKHKIRPAVIQNVFITKSGSLSHPPASLPWPLLLASALSWVKWALIVDVVLAGLATACSVDGTVEWSDEAVEWSAVDAPADRMQASVSKCRLWLEMTLVSAIPKATWKRCNGKWRYIQSWLSLVWDINSPLKSSKYMKK